MREYSAEIAYAISEYLVGDNWKYEYDDENGVFKFSLSMKGGIRIIDYMVVVNSRSFTSYASSSIGADYENSEIMAKMAEFICRVNYGIRNGCFEIDFSDGEIRYKSYVDCDDQMPTNSIIENSIIIPARMFKRYGSGIVSIIYGGSSAKDAVEKCEADLD